MIEENKARIKRWINWPKRTANDIVYDDLGIIFVHIPKTGGTSIKTLLKECTSTQLQRYPQLHQHPKSTLIKAAVGNKKWHSYTSVAVVRNPWDWSLSSYYWWIEKASRHENILPIIEQIKAMSGFEEYIHSDFFNQHIHNFRATDYIDWISYRGTIIVDQILRFETLSQDWGKFARAHGHGLQTQLPAQNKTSRGKDYQEYYTAEMTDIVAAKFSETIRVFNYAFK